MRVEGYELEELIGHGGMGAVYRARHVATGRRVALKVIHPHLIDQVEYQGRFMTEMRVALSLEHPNIIPVYEVGDSADTPYISMMMVRGQSLRDILGRHGSLGLDRALQVTDHVAAALEYAHSRRIVHRDVKPANVLLEGQTGHVYLTDFGIAKSFEGKSEITKTGMMIGALPYMAPEQLEEGDLNPKSDVYALGCMLFEMLTGALPFSATTDASLIREKLLGPPQRLDEFRHTLNPPALQAIEDALVTNPDDRPSGPLDLAAQARGELASPVQSPPTNTEAPTAALPDLRQGNTKVAPTRVLSRSASWFRIRRRATMALAALIAVCGIAAASILALRNDGALPVDQDSAFSSSDTPTTSASSNLSANEPDTSGGGSVTPVRRELFEAEVPSGWAQGDVDTANSGRLTNTWVSPSDPDVSVLIDAEIRSADHSPETVADPVRRATRRSSGYSEIGFHSITLNGRPSVEWEFEIPSEGRKVDYFFSECNVNFAVLGTAPSDAFVEYAATFRNVAESIKARCHELRPNSPITTEGIGPVLVGMSPEEVEMVGGIDLDATSMATGSCQYHESDSLPDIYFMFVEARLARIDARNADARTISGVSNGDSARSVIQAYGDNITTEPGVYDPKRREIMTFVPDDPDDDTRVVFEVFDGTVQSIRPGRLSAVEWIEGCA